MHRIDVNQDIHRTLSASDRQTAEDAVGSGSVWVEIVDPLSKWNGSIGLLMTGEFNHYYALESSKRGGFTPSAPGKASMFLYDFVRYYDKYPLNIGKKSIKICLHDHKVVLLADYDGPAVYKYVSDVTPKFDTPRDILGNEIVPGAFVAAGGGQGMFLAKVKEVFNEKYGREYRLRVRLEVVVDRKLIDWNDRAAGDMSPYRYTSEEPTVAIDNVMVITPDVQQKAMIAKLSRP